jgi:cytoskeletal protein RodZ
MATSLLPPGYESMPAPPPRGRLLQFAPEMDLRELSARTRLPLWELAALDAGDTSRCGGDFYLRAHLTCIASALRVSPDELLAAFDRRPSLHLDETALGARAPVRHRRRSTWRRAGTVVLVAGLVGVVAAGGYLGARHLTQNGTATPTAQQHAAPPVHPPVKHTTPPHVAAPPPIPPGTVVVALSVAGAPTWLSAQDQTGTTVFQGLVQPGTVQTLRGTSVHAVIGNAGAVTLACNNHQLGVMGTTGQVVTTTFAPGAGGC